MTRTRKSTRTRTTFVRVGRWLFASLVLFGLGDFGLGCKHHVECTTEVTAGTGTFKGTARGEGEKGPVMKSALREACQKMCVATKAPMIDACTARCAVDVAATKIGARTTCKD